MKSLLKDGKMTSEYIGMKYELGHWDLDSTILALSIWKNNTGVIVNMKLG